MKQLYCSTYGSRSRVAVPHIGHEIVVTVRLTQKPTP